MADLLVVVAALAAIAWVNWYFFRAGGRAPRAPGPEQQPERGPFSGPRPPESK